MVWEDIGMLLKKARQQKCWFVNDILCAVVHILRIAAFLFSTKKEIYRHRYTYFSRNTRFDALEIFWVRFLICPFRDQQDGDIHCRSPPLILILSVNSKIKIGGYYEENQSEGLLPVLYKGYYC